MPTSLDWIEITRRLAFTILAGGLLGLNRWSRGRAAGLRTTVLVCLAASIAMIEANLLLATAGRPWDSFTRMDVMRLPLGILDGMGFIGAGVIVRRKRMIVGVTTAATLWFATVMGLCFGGGQSQLGAAALGLGLFVLWCFRWLEALLPQEHRGILVLTLEQTSRLEEELPGYLNGMGCRTVEWAVLNTSGMRVRRLRCEIRWTPASKNGDELPDFVTRLSQRQDIVGLRWDAAGRPER